MFRVRPALALLTAMLAVLASNAQPGGGFAIVPSPLAVTLLPGIDHADLVAELKLSPDQTKALVAHRQAMWDEQYTTAPMKFAEGTAKRTEATDAFLKKTLTEAQYKRVVQIAAQRVLRNYDRGFGGGGPGFDPTAQVEFNVTRVSATTFTRNPELVAAFKLTDDQKTLLTTPAKGGKGDPFGDRGRGGVSIALTPEQSVAAKEFLGTPYTKFLPFQSDARLMRPPTPPMSLPLLDARDVRDELKFSDEQAKAFVALREKWAALVKARQTELSPKEANEKAQELVTESEKILATLKPEQTARLKQLLRQVTTSGRHIEQVYRTKAIATDIKLTEKQTEALDAIWDTYQKDASAAIETADSFDAAGKKTTTLIAVRQKKAEAVLTADQAAMLKGGFGEPFVGDTMPDSYPGRQAQVSAALRMFTRKNPQLESELKLAPDKMKAIAAARDAFNTAAREAGYDPRSGGGGWGGGYYGPGGYYGAPPAAVAAFEKVIADNLTDAQKKRVGQLVIQTAAANNLMFALTATDTAKALSITADQRTKLTAIAQEAAKLQQLRVQQVYDPEEKLALKLRDAADERMIAVLSDLQKATWKDLTGAPWDGAQKSVEDEDGGYDRYGRGWGRGWGEPGGMPFPPASNDPRYGGLGGGMGLGRGGLGNYSGYYPGFNTGFGPGGGFGGGGFYDPRFGP